MPLVPNASAHHWKSAALRNAEVITDAWEGAKASAGRAAEWMLFLCMECQYHHHAYGHGGANVHHEPVPGVQVVMLDSGGMSLSSVAPPGRERRASAAVRKVSMTIGFSSD